MKKYYSKKEVAKRWNCHPTTIDFRVKRGDLKPEIVKNRKKFHIDDIVLLETVDPVRPRPGRAPRKKAEASQPVEVKQPTTSIFAKIKKYIYDRFSK